ncbi:MAG: glycosyltransferase family 4 protein [Candidatus Binatus sp.]|uniref:glycosyltransferase family 4 protein n=1 Tax=Candidatus Binatus sp. TaxID=2811406 RepID=UPI002719DE10|nr:glycosyltransferase family 4 protein [Candidatus Binatus sp.]MDO8433174.1 glycosyltransferase family 4 protein [Candidatus Binatus sp.]
MRIALVARRFDTAGGGTERDLIITAEILRAAGHEITILADEVRSATGDWRVRRVGGARLGRALSLLRFAYAAAPAARRDRADLILSFARVIGADLMRSGGGAHASYLRAARKWRGRSGALAMRLSPYHQVQMLVERRGFRASSLKRALAVSELVRNDLIDTFHLPPEKALTIYNGVDLERFRPAREQFSERDEVRRRFGIPASARLVIFIGNGFARKGLGFLIEAWPLLGGGTFLLVVGSDRDRNSYARRADELNVLERVIFAGSQSNVEELLRAADAFALPSMFEPFGNVVMEAMASGLPVLTSAFCGVAELTPASMRGFIVEDPTDPGEIALRLGALLDSPSSLASEARATAEKFTWSRYGNELKALVDSIAK